MRCSCISSSCTRRTALTFSFAVTGFARALAQSGGERRIWIRSIVKRDEFSGTYSREGRYDRAALRALDGVARDTKAEETTPMDPRLWDVLSHIADVLTYQGPILLVEGYRTPESNTARARLSPEVSQISHHMYGMAADILMPGVGTGNPTRRRTRCPTRWMADQPGPAELSRRLWPSSKGDPLLSWSASCC